MSRPVRVRFAPSPTGYLHVGGARTALYNFLYAKNRGGKFILRIEDTDLERSTEEAMHMQIGDLKWLGLNWDEGVNPETLEDMGDKGPYRQSQRLEIYKEYAEKLIASGTAYYCFMTDEEIDKQREELKAAGKPPQVQSPYRDMDPAESKKKLDSGESAVVRFKVPKDKSEFVLKDLVRGEVKFPSDMVGDFVLIRSNGMPVYNFCCAIDDALMEISHVFRAEEHLSNTLRQMMVYEALGLEVPEFGHLSIILGADKQKLSKRHGATSCNQYRELGYLPEAMNNFIALMGWSHPEGKEVMTSEEMQKAFSTDRLNPASAVFDEVKLKWMNASHLRELDHAELWSRVKPFLDEAGLELPEDPQWQDRALSVFKTSMETLADAVELFRPISAKNYKVDDTAADALSWDSSKAVIEKWKSLVAAAAEDYLSEEQFVEAQNAVKTECGVKGKHLFMPIRVAVIGKPQGAELKHLVPLMKKDLLIERAQLALNQ
tara:strand:+ start:35676 stop:37142 length:1467 start_codon:yes stop_codon:yes gene_type:complete